MLKTTVYGSRYSRTDQVKFVGRQPLKNLKFLKKLYFEFPHGLNFAYTWNKEASSLSAKYCDA